MPCINLIETSDSYHTKITSDWVVLNHLDHTKTPGGATGPNYDAVLQSVPGATWLDGAGINCTANDSIDLFTGGVTGHNRDAVLQQVIGAIGLNCDTILQSVAGATGADDIGIDYVADDYIDSVTWGAIDPDCDAIIK